MRAHLTLGILLLVFFGDVQDLFSNADLKDRDPFVPSTRMITTGAEDDLLALVQAQSRSLASQTRKQRSQLELKGVWIGEEGRVAFINDATLLVGDEIEGFTVMAIERDSVELKMGTEEITLHLTHVNIPSNPSLPEAADPNTPQGVSDEETP